MKLTVKVIIKKFGGPRQMGRELDVHPATICNWLRVNRIHRKHFPKIIEVAEKLKLSIKEKDFAFSKTKHQKR